jgi:hypothetical protein
MNSPRSTCAASKRASQHAVNLAAAGGVRTSRPSGGAVSQLKPLARYARKDPMHPALHPASVDCRWVAPGAFAPDTSTTKCWCSIKAMLKTCITPVLCVFQMQVGAWINLQQVVNHAPR